MLCARVQVSNAWICCPWWWSYRQTFIRCSVQSVYGMRERALLPIFKHRDKRLTTRRTAAAISARHLLHCLEPSGNHRGHLAAVGVARAHTERTLTHTEYFIVQCSRQHSSGNETHNCDCNDCCDGLEFIIWHLITDKSARARVCAKRSSRSSKIWVIDAAFTMMQKRGIHAFSRQSLASRQAWTIT